MRALLVHPGPSFSVADVYAGWANGLEQCGVEIAHYNLGDRISFFATTQIEYEGELRTAFDTETALRMAVNGLEAACFRLWPDVVVIVSGFFIPPETFDILRGRGMKVVLIHTESPYEDDAQVQRAPYANLNILNDPTNLAKFKAVAPSVYLPHCYDPSIHHKRPFEPVKKSDLFFCGTGYPSRRDFFDACDFDGIDVKLGGNWQATEQDSPLRQLVVHPIDECMDNEDAHDWYAATKTSVNLYRSEANKPELSAGWSMGPREVELAAAGVFFLRDPRGEGDELLPMLPTFDGPEDFTEQLRWWLAHPVHRAEAAEKARHAVADRTFANNAAEMLRALDG